MIIMQRVNSPLEAITRSCKKCCSENVTCPKLFNRIGAMSILYNEVLFLRDIRYTSNRLRNEKI